MYDIIIMNPPYQTKSDKNHKKTQTLWDKFVLMAITVVKNDGWLCAIHPCGWRDVAGQFKSVQNVLKNKKINYLEMHDRADGVKTFGVQTAYDWYVLQNTDNDIKTTIVTQDGFTKNINLQGLDFIPNGSFDEIHALCAKNGQPSVEMLCDSSYHIQRDYVTEIETVEYKYPCIYSVLKDGTINLRWSSINNKGHFGLAKVVFSNGSSAPIIDEYGKYGLTEFAYAIVDTPENLHLIQKAMLSEKFLKLMADCQLIGKHRYHYKAIKLFRKDFWKEFVDEEEKCLT